MPLQALSGLAGTGRRRALPLQALAERELGDDMSAAGAAFIYSAEIEQYHYPPDCPFNTTRAGKARAILASLGLLAGGGRFEAPLRPAERREMLKFHSARYIDALAAAPTGRFDLDMMAMGLGTPDCPVFSGMYEYAALACGGTLVAAELIMQGRAEVAFNPSGGYHHAGSERASGFCYVNDVVLACGRLAEAGKRVLYLDIDAHHGDGVQRAFFERDDVMTISFHESGKTLFPGTGFPDEIGRGAGEGFAVNVPLPAGTYDRAYLEAFDEVAMPLIGAFDPDVIVLEIGMDALSGDPLTHLALTNNTHAAVAAKVRAFARPILAVGGGGYHIENTARGWALAWCALCGEDDRDAMGAGLGGVLMQSAEWSGGLRDRELVPDSAQAAAVGPQLRATVEAVKAGVFAIHGLST